MGFSQSFFPPRKNCVSKPRYFFQACGDPCTDLPQEDWMQFSSAYCEVRRCVHISVDEKWKF